MNREIKFRAYSLVVNKVCFQGKGLTLREIRRLGDSYFDGEIVWVEYTGLKDKNGKKIYESDRVKTPAGVGVIRWDRCFRLFWNDKDSTTLHDCLEEQLEVIGNIYSDYGYAETEL